MGWAYYKRYRRSKFVERWWFILKLGSKLWANGAFCEHATRGVYSHERHERWSSLQCVVVVRSFVTGGALYVQRLSEANGFRSERVSVVSRLIAQRPEIGSSPRVNDCHRCWSIQRVAWWSAAERGTPERGQCRPDLPEPVRAGPGRRGYAAARTTLDDVSRRERRGVKTRVIRRRRWVRAVGPDRQSWAWRRRAGAAGWSRAVWVVDIHATSARRFHPSAVQPIAAALSREVAIYDAKTRRRSPAVAAVRTSTDFVHARGMSGVNCRNCHLSPKIYSSCRSRIL